MIQEKGLSFIKTKISVAMCTYNGEKYIIEQLNSILNQTIPPEEIIICDDCSTDNTENLVKNIASNNYTDIKFIKNKKNLGSSKNFEKAISLCSYDIIFLSDQDDIWLPNKVKIIIKTFKNKDVDLVFSNAYLTDENLNILKYDLFKSLNFDQKKIDIIESEKAFNLLLKTNYATGATIAFKKSLLDVFFPLPDIWVHDHYLAFVCSISKKIYPIKSKLIYYRQHNNQQIGTLNINNFKKIKDTLSGKISIPRYYFFRMNKTMNILNEKNILTDEMKKELANYNGFLEMRQQIGNYGYLKKFCIISSQLNNYLKYSTGVKHTIIDFLYKKNKGI